MTKPVVSGMDLAPSRDYGWADEVSTAILPDCWLVQPNHRLSATRRHRTPSDGSKIARCATAC